MKKAPSAPATPPVKTTWVVSTPAFVRDSWNDNESLTSIHTTHLPTLSWHYRSGAHNVQVTHGWMNTPPWNGWVETRVWRDRLDRRGVHTFTNSFAVSWESLVLLSCNNARVTHHLRTPSPSMPQWVCTGWRLPQWVTEDDGDVSIFRDVLTESEMTWWCKSKCWKRNNNRTPKLSC